MKARLLYNLFWIAFLLRLAAALTLNLTGMLFSGLSRDSVKYHMVGVEISDFLAFGRSWPRGWLDNAWFQVIGHIYFWIGPYPILIQVLNAILGALAVVITARMVWLAYGDLRVAYFAGWLVAVFPSFIYFNALLLKDAFSLFLMASIGYAVVALRQRFTFRYVIIIFLCLLAFLGIREYMFMVGAALVMMSLLPAFGRSAVSGLSLLVIVALFFVLSWSLGFGFFGYDFFASSEYFDLEYINNVRSDMDKGSGAIDGGRWESGLLSNIWQAVLGLYFFLFSVNPFNLSSARQFFALPEMIMVMLCIGPLIRGFYATLMYRRATAIALIIFGVGIIAVYTSATTNAGAMFRWRIQAFPFLFGILAYGLTLRGSRGNPILGLMNFLTRRISFPQRVLPQSTRVVSASASSS